MMNLLHTIGLMTRAEHERLTRLKTEALDTIAQSYCGEVKAATDWEAKFKRAAANLAAQAEEIARLEADRNRWRKDCLAIIEEADDLRPDAEAMRKKRAADRKRMAAKRGKS